MCLIEINSFSECPLDVVLPDLPDNIFCTLSKTCNAIDCCMQSDLLQRNFALSIKVDQCKMTLTVAIEKLTFELSLLNYDWGKENVNEGNEMG